MRKPAETTARSTEPWASARSGRRFQAIPARRREREASARAFPVREAPPWAADRLIGNPEAIEDAERLPVGARGDEDLMAAIIGAAR